MQYTEESRDELIKWTDCTLHTASSEEGEVYETERIRIRMYPEGLSHSTLEVWPGDWVLKDWQGMFHVRKDKLFGLEFEPYQPPEEEEEHGSYSAGDATGVP